MSNTLARIEVLLEAYECLSMGIRCAHEIIALENVSQADKLHAVAEVLEAAVARADGGELEVSARTHLVLSEVQAACDARILLERHGVKTWGRA